MTGSRIGALLPETVFAFAMARVPAHAATASLLLLAAVLWPAAVIAQAAQDVPVKDRSALQRRLEAEIMCTCGCKSPMGSCPMRPNCGHYDQQEAVGLTYEDRNGAHTAGFPRRHRAAIA